MMISVYRQGRTRSQLDHLACMDMAASAVDLDLITFSFINGKPVIAGLEGATAVIKPLEPGDEAFTFETLYDIALSQHDFERLKRHQVQSPNELKPRLYEAVIVATSVSTRRCAFVSRRRNRLRSALAPQADAAGPGVSPTPGRRDGKQNLNSNDTTIASGGFLTVDDPARDNAPEWQFMEWPKEPPPPRVEPETPGWFMPVRRPSLWTPMKTIPFKQQIVDLACQPDRPESAARPAERPNPF